MAKAKEKVNKSELVRAALKEHPDMGPTEMSKVLGEQNPSTKFSPGLISLIKSKSKGKKQKRGRPAKTAPKAQRATRQPATNGTPLLDQLRQLKSQIGVEGIRVLVDSL